MVFQLSSLESPVLAWRKSTHSGGGNDCVEVAPLTKGTAMRDTKARELGMLAVSSQSWKGLLTAARGGDLDLS